MPPTCRALSGPVGPRRECLVAEWTTLRDHQSCALFLWYGFGIVGYAVLTCGFVWKMVPQVEWIIYSITMKMLIWRVCIFFRQTQLCNFSFFSNLFDVIMKIGSCVLMPNSYCTQLGFRVAFSTLAKGHEFHGFKKPCYQLRLFFLRTSYMIKMLVCLKLGRP